MANFMIDSDDVEFNLFELLEIQNNKLGLSRNDLKDILSEYEKFVRLEIFPTREISDHEGVKHVNGKVVVPHCFKSLHQSLYSNGWFALGTPESVGGTIVPEALSAACLSMANAANTAYMMYPGLAKGAMNVINLKGSTWMKEQIIPKMMEGKWGGTMCLTEAGAGSDVGALRTTATPIKDGRYKIQGVKIFISGGDNDLYENIIHLVLARTPGAEAGTKGISLFVVPKFKISTDSQGEANDVSCTKIEHKMGIHASATCELTFGANGNCEGYLIGEEFDGMATMFIMMNEARLLCGIQGESQGNLAYQMANKYAHERVQFSKEIVHHPDVRRMLAKMRASARGMRALMLYTASLFDLEKVDHKYSSYIGLLTPICKSYLTEQGFQLASEAVQVHGGYGYCSEYGVEQFVRDTVIGRIYEGTNGIQATDFLMRKVLKDQAVSLLLLVDEIKADFSKLDQVEFSFEHKLFQEVLNSLNSILSYFKKLGTERKMNLLLQHCHDFQMYCSLIFMNWRLAISAQKSFELKTNKQAVYSGTYLDSKINDFKIYNQYYLIHCLSLAKSILESKIDVSSIDL